MPEILSIGELLDLGNVHNSAYIPYSGLEYNASGAISGISGSAIAGGIESSVVSSIVSSMVSGKADQSAVESCCSAMSAEVSAKLDATASSLFQPSGNYQPSGDYYSATNPSGFITTADLTDYAKESALSSKLDASASSNFAPSGEYVFESSYSSFTSEVTNNISSISSTVSGLTGDYLDKSASSMFQPSGAYAYESSLSSYLPSSASSNFAPSADYAFASSLSSKLDASASSEFYLTSNPSGFITGVDLDGYATTGYVESSVSGKLDATASGQFQPSGSYAYESSLTSYIPFSSVSGENSQITAINGSAIGGTGSEFTGVVTDETLTGNGLPDSALGVDNYNVLFDSSLYSSLNGDNVTIGVQSGIYQPSGDYYPASNPSGFISSVDLSHYATTAYVDSAVSSKADSSALSSYVPYSGLEYNTASAISGINGSALAAGSTYSAGEGIDITDDIISVETPVDVVAGPGIVIDNPDGNTMRVSMAQNYETVLFSGSSYGVSFTETLSEDITNFEYLGISVSNAKNRATYTVYPVSEYPTNNMAVPTLFNKDASYAKGIGLHGMTIVFNKTSANAITCGCWLFNFNDTVGNSDSIYLTKIVGINRTASAQ